MNEKKKQTNKYYRLELCYRGPCDPFFIYTSISAWVKSVDVYVLKHSCTTEISYTNLQASTSIGAYVTQKKVSLALCRAVDLLQITHNSTNF